MVTDGAEEEPDGLGPAGAGGLGFLQRERAQPEARQQVPHQVPLLLLVRIRGRRRGGDVTWGRVRRSKPRRTVAGTFLVREDPGGRYAEEGIVGGGVGVAGGVLGESDYVE